MVSSVKMFILELTIKHTTSLNLYEVTSHVSFFSVTNMMQNNIEYDNDLNIKETVKSLLVKNSLF